MLKALAISAFLLATSSACSQGVEQNKTAAPVNQPAPALTDCDITSNQITTFGRIEGAQVSQPSTAVDPDSGEHIVTQTVTYPNGDSVVVQQKFCYMYSFDVTYRFTFLSKASFTKGLDNIQALTLATKQDYALKAKLADIVEMTMNQRGFSIDTAFEYGLPQQAVSSSEYVEHTLSLHTPSTSPTLRFNFSLGGE